MKTILVAVVLSCWQWVYLFAYAVPGKPLQEGAHQLTISELIDRLPPVDDDQVWTGNEWALRPPAAEMERRLRQGTPIPFDLMIRALTRTGAIRIRREWPLNHEFAVSLRIPSWLPSGTISMVPKPPNLKAAAAGRDIDPLMYSFEDLPLAEWNYQKIGLLPEGTHQVSFDVTIKCLKSSDRHLELVASGPLLVEVCVVPTIEQSMPGLTNARIERAVEDSIGLRTVENVDGKHVIVVVDPNLLEFPELNDLALSLRITATYKNTLMSTNVMLHPFEYAGEGIATVSVFQPGLLAASLCMLKLPQTIIYEDGADLDQWTITITGSSDLALAVWGKRQYWSGRLTLSARELFARERKRSPGDRPPWGTGRRRTRG